MRPLLDVNVLVALFDPAHPNHEDAHRWFRRSRHSGWASCAVTLNGCVRVLSNPAYPTVDVTPAQVISRLRTLCADPLHVFWDDDISLLSSSVVDPDFIAGHQKITDVHLLALARRHGGRLATFDRSIPLRAVRGAGAEHLELLGS